MKRIKSRTMPHIPERNNNPIIWHTTFCFKHYIQCMAANILGAVF